MIRNLFPRQAFELLQEYPDAVFIDVRSPLEYAFVGHPVGASLVPWKLVPNGQINPDFVAQVNELVANHSAPIVLICRTGQRSLEAAHALEYEGYEQLINIDGGFEGPLDAEKHRSTVGGWRFDGLPWEQS